MLHQPTDPTHAIEVTLRFTKNGELFIGRFVARESEIREGKHLEDALHLARARHHMGPYSVIAETIVAHLVVSPASAPRRLTSVGETPMPWELREAEGRGSPAEDVLADRIVV
jgi:hypothetical protein